MRGAWTGLEPEITALRKAGLATVWEQRPRLARSLQTDFTLALQPVIYIMKK